ncbi:unnamed protein product [Moneuplotes crassus]|uniref:Cyclin n=1 Tax=Euplotes crassus TaxID=5936 RepID=A0AAD1U8Y6_EUPCR|nr:unnamed protein product [Moneuplotes crassus]
MELQTYFDNDEEDNKENGVTTPPNNDPDPGPPENNKTPEAEQTNDQEISPNNGIDEQFLKDIFVESVSRILENMIQNSATVLNFNSLTVFDARDIPGISIYNYLRRIMAYSEATSRTIVMCLSHIDNLTNDDSSPVILTRHNIHRLLAVSMMVSAKFYEDCYLDNESWGEITGLSLFEINRLERKFLTYIDFKINTKLDCYIQYVQMLLSYAVESNIVDYDTAGGLLQAIVDASALEFEDSAN